MFVSRMSPANEVFRGGTLKHIKEYLISPRDRVSASLCTRAGAIDPLSKPTQNDVASILKFIKAKASIKQAIVERRNPLIMLKASNLGSDIAPYRRIIEKCQRCPNRKLSQSERLILRLNHHINQG